MAMDVVDRVIVNKLFQLGGSFFDSFPSKPETINEFNTDQIYEGIVLLLWACEPSSKSVISSTKLPLNMTSRFRSAMNVVSAVKAIGVRDEIDYQTLLYGRPKELRNVIIGLIEKLPKESPVIAAPKSPIANLVEGALASSSFKAQWPEINKHSFLQRNHWKPCWGTPRRMAFRGFNGDISSAMKNADVIDRQRSIICASLEANCRTCHSAVDDSERAKNLLNSVVLRTSERTLQKPALPGKPKPAVPAKPAELKTVQVVEPEPSELNKQEQRIEVEKTISRLSAIMEEVSAVSFIIESKKGELLRKEIKVAEDTAAFEGLKTQDQNIDARLMKLLETPETVTRLMKYIEESDERMEDLQNRWIKVKSEKDEEIRKAREAYASEVNQEDVRQETLQLLRQADEIEKQLTQKQTHLLKLERQAEKMESVQINRTAYTKRIFDIVSNIKKQQEDINKVLSANRQLQKEIRSLAGKLERTFTVVEERLYKDVQRDNSMQRAYRLLVKIHEECAWVVSAIEECGQLNRDIDEISDQIVTQQQKGIDETLEKLLNDWMEVKKENTELQKQLQPS